MLTILVYQLLFDTQICCPRSKKEPSMAQVYGKQAAAPPLRPLAKHGKASGPHSYPLLLSISGFCSYKFDWWALLLALSQDLKAVFHHISSKSLTASQLKNYQLCYSILVIHSARTGKYWKPFSKPHCSGLAICAQAIRLSHFYLDDSILFDLFASFHHTVHDWGDIPNVNNERSIWETRLIGEFSSFVVDLIRNLL